MGGRLIDRACEAGVSIQEDDKKGWDLYHCHRYEYRDGGHFESSKVTKNGECVPVEWLLD